MRCISAWSLLCRELAWADTDCSLEQRTGQPLLHGEQVLFHIAAEGVEEKGAQKNKNGEETPGRPQQPYRAPALGVELKSEPGRRVLRLQGQHLFEACPGRGEALQVVLHLAQEKEGGNVLGLPPKDLHELCRGLCVVRLQGQAQGVPVGVVFASLGHLSFLYPPLRAVPLRAVPPPPIVPLQAEPGSAPLFERCSDGVFLSPPPGAALFPLRDL